MKKDIKKRVIESDIEKSKKNSKKASFIMIIVLLIIIVFLVLFLLYDYEIIFPEKEKNTTSEITSKRHEEKDIKLDINNPNIINLYSNVHDNISQDLIYNNKKMTTSKMNEEYKLNLAYNIYQKNIVDDTTKISISENDVKSAYELIFGVNSYKHIDNIRDKCNTLHYNSLTKSFENTSPSTCNIKKDNTIHEKMISAVKNKNKELIITTAIVYNIETDNSTSNLCQDIECNKILTENNGDYTRDKHFNDYIDANKDNLQQISYKYELDEDGFYYYVGYSRSKN